MSSLGFLARIPPPPLVVECCETRGNSDSKSIVFYKEIPKVLRNKGGILARSPSDVTLLWSIHGSNRHRDDHLWDAGPQPLLGVICMESSDRILADPPRAAT